MSAPIPHAGRDQARRGSRHTNTGENCFLVLWVPRGRQDSCTWVPSRRRGCWHADAQFGSRWSVSKSSLRRKERDHKWTCLQSNDERLSQKQLWCSQSRTPQIHPQVGTATLLRGPIISSWHPAYEGGTIIILILQIKEIRFRCKKTTQDLIVHRVRAKAQEYLTPVSRFNHDDKTFLALKSTGIKLRH